MLSSAQDGDVLISAPVVSRLGASKGKYIVNVSTPVTKDNTYRGVLSASVVLDELTNQYILPLKVTKKSFEYLLAENGDVLATDQPGILETNFLEQLEKNPFVGSAILAENLKKILGSRQEGKIRVAFPIDIPNGELKVMLVAHSPVTVGDNNLMLATAVPIEDALIFMTPIYTRSVVIIVGAFFAILILAIRLAKLQSYREAAEDEHRHHSLIDKTKNG